MFSIPATATLNHRCCFLHCYFGLEITFTIGYTHTHTHTHIYIYIYIERERENEVEAGGAMMGQDETRTSGAARGTPNR